jgi:hypothetical protein
MSDMTAEKGETKYRPKIISPEGTVEKWEPYQAFGSEVEPQSYSQEHTQRESQNINDKTFRDQVDAQAEKGNPAISTHTSRTHPKD